MRVLAIGSDRTVFQPNSQSPQRQIAYSAQFDALDIIVFSLLAHKCAPTTLATGVHVHPTASRSRVWYVFDAIRVARRLPRPDVVTAQDPFEAGLAALLIARLRGAPLHVQIHTDFLASAFVRSSFLNRVRVFLAGIVLRRARRIRVVSNRIKDSLQATSYKLQAPITVLPIFVDREKFRTARAGSLMNEFVQFRKKVVVIARLEAEKNVRLALDSFAKVAPDDACLVIVGEGRERRALEKRAAHHNISDQVFFEGEKDPLPYYALADLVLVPSKYEGYGLVIVEALAAEKPVLSTDVGVAREAGAIVTTPEKFPAMLASWFEEGMRTGKLLHYPYRDFDEYVAAYTSDISACVGEAARRASSTERLT
ncbi:MAG: glycosyltransferase [Patescibacteria group bacterium]|mgnify:CR=1 FL=1